MSEDEKVPDIKIRPMSHGAIDPNRARYYWLAGSAVAALVAVMTIKSNWDYFGQYYSGFAFWARVICFFAVEAMIILLPAIKGFGNKSQGNAALVFEVLLFFGALTHTWLVNDASLTKIQAGKAKTEASADFDRTSSVAQQIAESNQKLQENYNRSIELWNGTVRTARREGRPAPEPPQAPVLQDVPQISQEVVSNATASVEMAGEKQVSHETLLGLLFALVGLVVVSVTTLLFLADGNKVMSWLKGLRAEELKDTTQGQARVIKSPMAMSPQPAAQDSTDFQQRRK